MSRKICRHYLIEGRVQGVWFRTSTQEQAKKQGVTGWVRNHSNGSVEVLLCGEETAVLGLEPWLHHGPRAAKVTAIAVEERPWENFDTFEVR